MKKLLMVTLFFAFLGIGFAQKEKNLSPEEKAKREKNIQAGNPFKKFGYTPKIATLSKGKYLEFHDLDSIVPIGSLLYNVNTKKIISFKSIDTLGISEATLEPEIISRWMNPDPLSEEFPSWTPYNFVLNNPIKYTDPQGLAPMGQDGIFIDENGNEIGNDGIDDGKVYVIKTDQTSVESGASFDGITTSQKNSTVAFVTQNSGNTEAFQNNSIAYDNSVEIEGAESTRQGMVDVVNQDDGTGGKGGANSKEYGGVINKDGSVVESKGGKGFSINQEITSKTKATFHSHPSGSVPDMSLGSPPFYVKAQEGPSFSTKPTEGMDINSSRTTGRRGYMFQRGSGKVYIYNSKSGVKAIIPQKNFVKLPKK